MLKDDLNPCRASSQNVLKTLSFGIWVGFVPFGLSAWLGLFGAWNEHARGPGSLSFFGAHFQHAQGSSAAFGLDWAVERINQLHDLWSYLYDVLALRLHPLLLLFFDSSQLGGEVVRLEGVEDSKEKFSIAGGLAVEALVRDVRHDGRLRCAVIQDFRVGELLVARDFDLAKLVVLEIALAAVEQGANELHSTVAALWEVYLACIKKSGKVNADDSYL